MRHSIGWRFLYGAPDSHPFFPSHVASGRCFLSAAAAGAPAGVVSAFAEPSRWCAGAVRDVAGCAPPFPRRGTRTQPASTAACGSSPLTDSRGPNGDSITVTHRRCTRPERRGRPPQFGAEPKALPSPYRAPSGSWTDCIADRGRGRGGGVICARPLLSDPPPAGEGG